MAERFVTALITTVSLLLAQAPLGMNPRGETRLQDGLRADVDDVKYERFYLTVWLQR